MPDEKISATTPATTLTGTELVPIVQSGINKTATPNLLLAGETGIHTDTYDPTGWLPNQVWNKATVAIVSTTKLKITISSTTNLSYYWRGLKVNLGVSTFDVTSTDDKAEGIWYCYSIDGVNFVLNQTPFYIFDIVSGNIRADLMIWEFYWDNVNDTTLWIQPERHSSQWSRSEHGYNHESMGTRYSNGLDITYGTTYANTDTRVKLTSGELHDEDISVYVVHSATPTAIWQQILGSAGTADANYAALPIYYLSGATPVWRKTTTSSYPFLPLSDNYIYYNRNNTGTWDYSTSIGSTNFVVYWVVGTSNESEPVVIIPGRLNNANLTAAQAEGFPVLTTLFTEFKLLYKIIYQTAGAANTNNGKCKINSVVDYRRDAIANNASATNTPSAALVSYSPSTYLSSTNVQAALEEVSKFMDPIAFDFNDVDQGYTQTWILDVKATRAYTITGVVLQSDDTIDGVEIQIGSTAVTWTGNATSINVTGSVVETTAIATNLVSAGNQVKLVTSGTDGTPTLIRGKILRTAV